MNTLNDLLGRRIEIGDTLAYPGRRGSSVYMNVGTVVAFDTFYGTIKVRRNRTTELADSLPNRLVTLTAIDHVVVISSDIGPAPTLMRAEDEIAALGGIGR